MEKDYRVSPCPESPTEFAYLRWAVQRAKAYGLYREFAGWYRTYRKNGDSVFDAAWYALDDWDMLGTSFN